MMTHAITIDQTYNFRGSAKQLLALQTLLQFHQTNAHSLAISLLDS